MSGLLREVADYYSAALAEHGPKPEGADWHDEKSQVVRFEQLARIIDTEPFSLTDVGCGYGAMFDFLAARHKDFSYTGIDIAAPMIDTAEKVHEAHTNASFALGSEPPAATDYCVASGIFNVRQQRSSTEWYDYILATLAIMNRFSTRGFAANFLPSYADEDKKRDYLYYANPDALAAYCSAYGEATILRDYGLYDFTLLVRKS